MENNFSLSLEHPEGDTYKRLAYRLFFQNILGFAWLNLYFLSILRIYVKKSPKTGLKSIIQSLLQNS